MVRFARIYRAVFIPAVCAAIVFSFVLTLGSYRVTGGEFGLNRPIAISSDASLSSVFAHHPVARHFQFAAKLRLIAGGGTLAVPTDLDIDRIHVESVGDVEIVRYTAGAVPDWVVNAGDGPGTVTGDGVFNDDEFVAQQWVLVVPTLGTSPHMQLYVVGDRWIVIEVPDAD